MTMTGIVATKIVFRGESPKLSSRGKGVLTYELGITEDKEDILLRIAKNSHGGTCSNEWVKLSVVEELLKDQKVFTGAIFRKAFISRSSNNSGYLAAILKTENVIMQEGQKGSQLSLASFTGIKAKVKDLISKGVELEDHIAIAQEKRKADKVNAQSKTDVKEKSTPKKK